MNLKRNWLWFIVVVTVVAAMAGVAFYHDQAEKWQHIIAGYQLRATADELFIRGDFDEALTIYVQLDSMTADSMNIRRQAQITKPEEPDSQTIYRLQQEVSLLKRQLKKYTKLHTDKSSLAEPNNEQDFQKEVETLKTELAALKKNLETVGQQGTLRFINGKNNSITYVGDIKDGMANGKGFAIWPSGSTYDGIWHNNQRHGKGVFLWSDGVRYEGEYENDFRNGFGVYTTKSGRYEGDWKNDKRHGEGKLFEPSGKLKVHGIWENDKLVKTLR